MKTLLVLIFLPTFAIAQWDYHAHFWGSATLSFGLHFKLGQPERVKYPVMVLSLGLLKEYADYCGMGTPSWLDVRADITGTALGFIVSDTWLRHKRSKALKRTYD